MRARADMVMLGSTGRNAGKTEFACRLIRNLKAAAVPVTAVKITPVRGRGGACARGGEGCGVCGGLEGVFAITEETDRSRPKDTGRMLAAGADRVLWLRVRWERLAEGMAALLDLIEPGGAVVCESNAGRLAVKPGLFLMFHPRGGKGQKGSSGDVIHLADRVVAFDGTGWSLDPGRCRFHRGAWSLEHDASAVILAGGASRRMGRDKSLVDMDGLPLIARIAEQLAPLFPEVLVSANETEKYRFLGLPIIPDEVQGQGPLMGILSSLKAAGRERMLAVACDIPLLDRPYIERLMELARGADVVMPVSPGGRHEPLLAVYGKAVIPVAQRALAEGKRRIIEVLSGLKACHPPLPEYWYFNLNTPEDLDAFHRRPGAKAAILT